LLAAGGSLVGAAAVLVVTLIAVSDHNRGPSPTQHEPFPTHAETVADISASSLGGQKREAADETLLAAVELWQDTVHDHGGYDLELDTAILGQIHRLKNRRV
jgi:hypothetical protein